MEGSIGKRIKDAQVKVDEFMKYNEAYTAKDKYAIMYFILKDDDFIGTRCIKEGYDYESNEPYCDEYEVTVLANFEDMLKAASTIDRCIRKHFQGQHGNEALEEEAKQSLGYNV